MTRRPAIGRWFYERMLATANGVSRQRRNRRFDVSLTLLKTSADGLRLKTEAVAVPALTSQVRPALVLPELQARALLDACEPRGRLGRRAASAPVRPASSVERTVRRARRPEGQRHPPRLGRLDV